MTGVQTCALPIYDKTQSGEEQSGIKEFHYTIGGSKASGTFSKNEIAEITITNWGVYTIKVTATEAKASKYTIKIKGVARR